MRFAVRVQARLRGMGYESRCEVIALKTSPVRLGESSWSHCHVLDGPSDWPDGEYTLDLGGFTTPARLQGGLWLAPPEHEVLTRSDHGMAAD